VVVGPTLGVVVGLVTAVVCWPFGALVYCCSASTGSRAFAAPVNTYTSVKSAIPI
jgi:hypothetical protein